MLTLLLFKKGYEKQEKGKTIKYDRYFVSEPDGEFKMSATLTNAFKDNLNSVSADFPLLLSLDEKEKDYFFTKDTFDNNTGEIDSIYKIVINSAREIAHADIKQVSYEEAKQFNQHRKEKQNA